MNYEQVRKLAPQIKRIARKHGIAAEKLLGVPVDVVPLSTLEQVKDREFAANIQREAVSL